MLKLIIMKHKLVMIKIYSKRLKLMLSQLLKKAFKSCVHVLSKLNENAMMLWALFGN